MEGRAINVSKNPPLEEGKQASKRFHSFCAFYSYCEWFNLPDMLELTSSASPTTRTT